MNYLEFQQNGNRQLVLNTSKAVRLINHYQIIYIEADSNYSKIFLEDHTEFLLSKTLGVVEDEINDEIFFRCHRAYLVNLLFIREIYKGCDMCIVLKNGTKIPLAKRRFCDLRKLISGHNKASVYSGI